MNMNNVCSDRCHESGLLLLITEQGFQPRFISQTLPEFRILSGSISVRAHEIKDVVFRDLFSLHDLFP